MNRRSLHRYYASCGLILPVCLLLTACGSPEPPPAEEVSRPVKTETVGVAGQDSARAFPARIKAVEQVDLAFRVSGTLLELPIRDGQKVAKDDIVARLDPRDFETRVVEAKSSHAAGVADLDSLKAGTRPEDIGKLEASLAAAQAKLAQARADQQRAKEMSDQGLISRRDYEASSTSLDVMQADVERSSQELAKARAGAREEEIRAAEARVEGLLARVREAEAALEDTVLRAPFDGVIAQKLAENFQQVQAKESIARLQNVLGLELEVQVPESLVLRLKRDAKIDFVVTFPTEPGKEFPAEFRGFNTQADPTTQNYTLTLSMERPESVTVLPGMTAQVYTRGTSEVDETGLLAPLQAIVASPDGAQYVWVIQPDSSRAERRTVKTGAIRGDHIEIREGLAEGDVIATAGASYLREGMLVRSLEK